MSKIGDLLKKRREELNYTQAEIATHLRWNTAQQVSNYERGVCLPPRESLKDIIKFLKLNYDDVWDELEKDLKEQFMDAVAIEVSKK